jgi:hypothetical protein
MIQVASLLGAATLLLAYFFIQNGRVNANSWTYIVLNLIGAVALSCVSIYYVLWGNIVLDITWTAIGISAVYKKVRSDV